MSTAAKVGLTLLVACWAVVYTAQFGPQFVLWFCCTANFYLCIGVWRRSALWFSLAGVSVLLLELLFTVDLAVALLTGQHPIGGTEYMFSAERPWLLRLLSLYHVGAPLLIVWGVRTRGYDARAPFIQAVVALAVCSVGFVGFDPFTQTDDAVFPTVDGVPFDRDFNINWVHGLFDRPGRGGPYRALLVVLIGYPLCILWPSHHLLSWIAQRGVPRPASLEPSRATDV